MISFQNTRILEVLNLISLFYTNFVITVFTIQHVDRMLQYNLLGRQHYNNTKMLYIPWTTFHTLINSDLGLQCNVTYITNCKLIHIIYSGNNFFSLHTIKMNLNCKSIEIHWTCRTEIESRSYSSNKNISNLLWI